jgi:hypothetical protein
VQLLKPPSKVSPPVASQTLWPLSIERLLTLFILGAQLWRLEDVRRTRNDTVSQYISPISCHSYISPTAKPCAFYQTMQCPFTAEECDFSHVLSNDGFSPHLPLSNSRTKLCKYFHAGTCTQGFFCRFKHPSGQGELISLYAKCKHKMSVR